MATRDHYSTMKMKGKHALNDVDGNPLHGASGRSAQTQHRGVEGGMTDYCHTVMAIHPNMAAGSYLCEVESRLSVETPLFPV